MLVLGITFGPPRRPGSRRRPMRPGSKRPGSRRRPRRPGSRWVRWRCRSGTRGSTSAPPTALASTLLNRTSGTSVCSRAGRGSSGQRSWSRRGCGQRSWSWMATGGGEDPGHPPAVHGRTADLTAKQQPWPRHALRQQGPDGECALAGLYFYLCWTVTDITLPPHMKVAYGR